MLSKINFLILSIVIAFLLYGQFREISPPIIPPNPNLPTQISEQSFFSFYLTMQANQFALLQIYFSVFAVTLAALGIVLAAIAIWGYKELKNIALKMAESKINQIVPNLVKREIERLIPEEQARANFEMNMGKSPADNSSEALTDCISAINKDPMEILSEIFIEEK